MLENFNLFSQTNLTLIISFLELCKNSKRKLQINCYKKFKPNSILQNQIVK